VKITATNFSHACEPGVQSQILARKTSGHYSRQVDEEQLKTILSMLEAGNISPAVLRYMLRPFIPDNVEISSDDIRNFRARALGLRSKGVSLASDAVNIKMLLSFKGLEDTETIELGSDNVYTAAKELLHQTLLEPGGIWNVIRFLDRIKTADPTMFEYEVARDKADGQPIGVIWTTRSMREAFVRFGDILFLDFMKHQMNHLHWPYHGPVVLDEEM
jgi:hypothetical protein